MLLLVTKAFTDKYTKEQYTIGQEIEVTDERGFEIIYSPVLGTSFVKPILEEKKVENDNDDNKKGTDGILKDLQGNEIEFPQSKGGGYYILSNGETVKGKDTALAAEEALAAE